MDEDWMEDTRQDPTVSTVLSALTVLSGVLLMILNVTEDSEPGLIPLALVAFGTGWFVRTWIGIARPPS